MSETIKCIGADVEVTQLPPAGWYSINLAGDTADVRIYGMVGHRAMGGAVNAADFAKGLSEVKAKTINLRLNTEGGSVFEGVAIYNALKNHGARIVAHVDGLAASIGSFIAMAADEIRIAKNAYMMLHNPMTGGGGMADARDLRRTADTLDKLRKTIVGAYAARTKQPEAEIERMMDEETWLNAEEAKAKGFADAISGEAAIVAVANLSAFNHVPDALKAPATPEPEPKAPEPSPGGDPLPVQDKETPPMAETPTQAPAPTPAAGNPVPIPQGETPPTTPTNFSSVQDAVKHFQSVAGPQFFERGRVKGEADGVKAATDRLKAILDVCPGRPQMALDAYLAGQTPAAVKLAVDEATRVENIARQQRAESEMEIARLNTLLSLGGHPGVDVGLNAESPTGMEPKAQAGFEWDRNPAVRKGFSNKENYVIMRTAELEGRFTRQAAPASR